MLTESPVQFYIRAAQLHGMAWGSALWLSQRCASLHIDYCWIRRAPRARAAPREGEQIGKIGRADLARAARVRSSICIWPAIWVPIIIYVTLFFELNYILGANFVIK